MDENEIGVISLTESDLEKIIGVIKDTIFFTPRDELLTYGDQTWIALGMLYRDIQNKESLPAIKQEDGKITLGRNYGKYIEYANKLVNVLLEKGFAKYHTLDQKYAQNHPELMSPDSLIKGC